MKIKNLIMLLLLTTTLISPAHAEDYQYDYFSGDDPEREKYVPFSDYIPKVRKHYFTVPHYLEDYYLLYGMPQHYNENSLRKNIGMLKTALDSKFRHPINALCRIESENEYYKYRNIMFMHLNLLIMRNYMKIAVRYDKRTIRFYDAEYAEDLEKSLAIAEELYSEALPYWREAQRYARRASEIKITLDMGTIESTRFSIITGELNYERIINGHIAKTVRKRQQLAEMAAAAN
ncbi:MAG: hypothetical protein PF637_00930 [Spirochaetes bacterium]|jgi:hypothetical protein|nr:hypothetical protein [Spirochaetota bacterium]